MTDCRFSLPPRNGPSCMLRRCATASYSSDEECYSSDEEWLRGPGSVAAPGAVVRLDGGAPGAAAGVGPVDDAVGAPRARGTASRARVPLGQGWDAVCVTCGEPHGRFGCEQLDAEMEAEECGLWMFE